MLLISTQEGFCQIKGGKEKQTQDDGHTLKLPFLTGSALGILSHKAASLEFEGLHTNPGLLELMDMNVQHL